jgi:hypothetical protein
VRFRFLAFIVALLACCALPVEIGLAQLTEYPAPTNGPYEAPPGDVQMPPGAGPQSAPMPGYPAPQGYAAQPNVVAAPQGYIGPSNAVTVPPGYVVQPNAVAAPPGYTAPPNAGALPPGAYVYVPGAWVPAASIVQPPVEQPEVEVAPGDVHWPRWSFDVAVMSISRDNNSRASHIYQNLFATTPQFGAVAAPDIALGYFVDPKNQWQLRYFDAVNLEAEANTLHSDPQLELDYVSNMHNAEINYIHTWNHWSLIGGFRYIHLDEQFTDNFFDSGGNLQDRISFRTNNNLYGGQLGYDYHREWSRFVFDTSFKFGLFGNAASQHEDDNDFHWSNHPTALADAIEFNLYLGHRFSPHLLGRVGMDVLSIGNVALAHDVEFTSFADGTVTFVGLSVGLTAQW